MVAEIKRAFEDSLKHVTWMDPETKDAAKEKASDSFHEPTALPPAVGIHLLQRLL